MRDGPRTPVRPMFVVGHNGAHEFGGAERGLARILAGLQARGHRVLLVCADPAVAREVERLGVPTRVLPMGGDVAVHHAVRLAAALRRLRPDVLVAGTFRKLWLTALAGRLARVPRVVLRVGLETDLPRNLKYRVVVPWLDAVVLKADDARPRWRDALPGVERMTRLVTIHGAVEPPRATRGGGALRAELGIPADAFVIGAVARLVRQKRFDRLVRVLASLPPDVHCVLAGEGAERAAIEQLAAQRGVDGRLHLLGHRDDVGDVLAALDVFVVCSDREMLAFAMLEALAAGVPVVSTPVSGAREALEAGADGDAAGVVTGWEADDIADALRALRDDAPRRAALAMAARRRSAGRFGFARMVDEWERLLAGQGGEG